MPVLTALTKPLTLAGYLQISLHNVSCIYHARHVRSMPRLHVRNIVEPLVGRLLVFRVGVKLQTLSYLLSTDANDKLPICLNAK